VTLTSTLFFVSTGEMPESLRQTISRHLEINAQHFGLARFITEEEFHQGAWHSDEFAMVTLGRPLLRGEVGCALAHQRIYSMASKGTSEWSLVLEEDAKWCSGSEESFAEVVSALNLITDKPAVVLLGWNAAGVGPVVGCTPLNRMLGIPTETFAYFINKPAAKLLSQTSKVEHIADWPINATKVRFFRAKHQVFVQNPDLSSVVDAVSSISRTEANRNRLGVFRRFLLLRSKPKLIAFAHFVGLRAIAFFLEKILRNMKTSLPSRNKR
jgi:GR25 family glycosyltransferase involved in LPS biosynthesis